MVAVSPASAHILGGNSTKAHISIFLRSHESACGQASHFLIIYSNYIPLLTLHIFSFIRLFSLLAVLRDTFMRSAHSSSGTSTHRMSNSVRSSSVKLHSARRYLISGIVNSQIFNFYPLLQKQIIVAAFLVDIFNMLDCHYS